MMTKTAVQQSQQHQTKMYTIHDVVIYFSHLCLLHNVLSIK